MSQSAALDLNLHPKQGEALNTDATEVLYGGAAGGGKSHLMRVAAIIWCSMIPGLQVYLFRRIRDDLIKNHMEGPKGFRAILAAWNQAGLVTIVEDEIRFWNGSKIYLCHCKDEKDIYKYQGAEIHVLIIDELTHFTERMYRFLRNRVRMVGVKLPVQWRGKFPRILCGANPGNVGHQFVKTTFVDAAAPMACVLQPKGEGGMLRQFIPARLEDNPSMAEDDPGYENRLEGLGSAELVKAMRWGDWNVVEGAFFDKWSNRNIVKPFTVPQLWTRFRSFDWGYAKPFSVGWWAVASDPFSCGHVTIPRGALVRYREWYGCTGKPNEGVRLEAEQIAAGIKEREKGETIAYGVADPSIFSEDGGPSHGERMARAGLRWRRADNTRVGKMGALSGWDQVRTRILGDVDLNKDGVITRDGGPMLVVFDTCRDFIRTVPVLQHDPDRPEDLDCWVAGTMVSTPHGDVAIENIHVGDLVDTPLGPREVLASYLSGSGETVTAQLSDGRELKGTPRHKIYIDGRGLVMLCELQCGDIPQERLTWSKWSSMAVSSIVACQVAITTIRAAMSSMPEARAFIGKLGSMLTGRYLRIGMCITSTATTTTTTSKTLSASTAPSMSAATYASAFRVTLDSGLRSGVGLRRVRQPSETTRARCWSARQNVNVRADIVAALLSLSTLRKRIAPIRAAWNTSIPSSLYARLAGKVSGRSHTRPNRLEPARIVAVGRCDESEPVYNLTVEEARLFYANGVLSSNTSAEDHAADEARYGCLSRPMTAKNPVRPNNPPDLGYGQRKPVGANNWKTL